MPNILPAMASQCRRAVIIGIPEMNVQTAWPGVIRIILAALALRRSGPSRRYRQVDAARNYAGLLQRP
jgi:hypothetical protein